MNIHSFRKISGLALILLFILSFLSGCADITVYNYDYKGESANWTAEYKGFSQTEFYKENGTLHTKWKSDGNLIYTYKGALSELSSVREIDYEFVTGSGRRTFGGAPFDKKFTVKTSMSGAPEESLNLKIIVDGKAETIILKKR